ncbi:MAG: hypothetical protein KF886_24055 [Candidatus Hydrogenedentes bacterium]|nr:hypothetical protein [Candidatus Hydrogenedentota bacterium]
MSSILEALKKLEAEKHAQAAPPIREPELATAPDFSAASLLAGSAPAPRDRVHLAPVTLVLAGGVFTMLVIGVSVVLSILLLRSAQPSAATGSPPHVAPAMMAAAPALAPPAPDPASAPAETRPPEEPPAEEAPPAPVKTAARTESRPPRPAPRREEPVSESPAVVAFTEEVRYERFVPEPARDDTRPARPVPEDIRSLPMLSRSEKAQYRLDTLKFNMLNEANAQRPMGSAVINLEKIFIGETLPGTNAKLIDVRNHGIAVEIQSTRQQYYIPR